MNATSQLHNFAATRGSRIAKALHSRSIRSVTASRSGVDQSAGLSERVRSG